VKESKIMTTELISWNWIPLIAVGPVKFGEPVLPLIKKYQLIREPEYDAPGWESYEFPSSGEIVSVEDSSIVNISCYENILYKGKNLLGLSLDEVRFLIGLEDEFGEKIEGQIPVEYFRLGLQIWLEDSSVVSATCYGPTYE
jgi:hypothetical protein